jgi:hypothetical protein
VRRVQIPAEIADWIADARRASQGDKERFHRTALGQLQQRYLTVQGSWIEPTTTGAGLTLSTISPSSDGAAILEKPVSDRGTLEDLSQSRNFDF